MENENENEEPKDLSADFLSSVIDDILIRLKQKEIAEQVRSNKVIEGVLFDICGGVREVAVNLENSYNLNLERDIMETKVHARGRDNIALCGEKGASVKLGDDLHFINCAVCLANIHKTDNFANAEVPFMGEPDETEQAEPKSRPIDDLAVIVNLLARNYPELEKITKHLELMRLSQQRILGDITEMNIRLKTIAAYINHYVGAAGDEEPEPEASKAAAVQKANDAVPVVEAPVTFHLSIAGRLAACGALGTSEQPIDAGPSNQITGNWDGVTCPKCRKIIEANQ